MRSLIILFLLYLKNEINEIVNTITAQYEGDLPIICANMTIKIFFIIIKIHLKFFFFDFSTFSIQMVTYI